MKIQVAQYGSTKKALEIEVDPIVVAKDIPYFLVLVNKRDKFSLSYMYNAFEKVRVSAIKNERYSVEFDRMTKNIIEVEYNKSDDREISILDLKKLFHDNNVLLNDNVKFDLDLLERVLVETKLTSRST